MFSNLQPIKAIFIGTSAGGVQALNSLFKLLPNDYKIPVIVVLHVGEKPLITTAFHSPSGVRLLEADEKDLIKPKHIYFAPSGYHLLVESDQTFSLTTEDKVQYARPSLDVTMDSLAQVYEKELLGVVLTGANEDGADGLSTIKHFGGLTVVQDPNEAEHKTMPKAALDKTGPHYVLSLNEIATLMKKLEGIYE